MRFSIWFTAILSMAFAMPSWPGPMPEIDVCRNDSKACRMLAVEVLKLDFSDLIDRELKSKPRDNFLCPAENPRCCPPHLLPLCMQQQEEVVQQSSKSISVGLDSFFCVADGGTFDELSGSCTAPTNQLPPWEPPFPPFPKDCGCNKELNDKGLCVKKTTCKVGNRVTPCIQSCQLDPPKVAKMSSNLGRNVGDRSVQLEAAKQLRRDLKLAMEVLDAEIKELKKGSKSTKR